MPSLSHNPFQSLNTHKQPSFRRLRKPLAVHSMQLWPSTRRHARRHIGFELRICHEDVSLMSIIHLLMLIMKFHRNCEKLKIEHSYNTPVLTSLTTMHSVRSLISMNNNQIIQYTLTFISIYALTLRLLLLSHLEPYMYFKCLGNSIDIL